MIHKGDIMKKKNMLFFAVVLTLAIISTGIIVYAQNETPCIDHVYKVATFSNGEATLICKQCGETCSDCFSDHLNERGYEPLDMNSDGIVNAKDYAYLIHHYDSNGPISGWETPIIGL